MLEVCWKDLSKVRLVLWQSLMIFLVGEDFKEILLTSFSFRMLMLRYCPLPDFIRRFSFLEFLKKVSNCVKSQIRYYSTVCVFILREQRQSRERSIERLIKRSWNPNLKAATRLWLFGEAFEASWTVFAIYKTSGCIGEACVR